MKQTKVLFNENDNNKSEIIYANLVHSMNDMKLTKEEQIKYLCERINYIETNFKNRTYLTLIILINTILFCLGLLFMYLKVYVLGITFCITSFVLIITLLLSNKHKKPEISSKYSEIENLRKSLNSKLK